MLTFPRGSLGWNVSSNGTQRPFSTYMSGFRVDHSYNLFVQFCRCGKECDTKILEHLVEVFNPIYTRFGSLLSPEGGASAGTLMPTEAGHYVGARPGYAHRRGFGSVAAIQRKGQSNLQRSTSLVCY
jgi:hypothetical protein